MRFARREDDADRAAEGGRAAAKVDGDVEHLAGDAPHELALRVLDLVMETAQHAMPRLRMVILHEGRVDAGVRQRTRVPALEEIPAVVREHARLEALDVGQVGCDDLHRNRTLGSRKSSSRYLPYPFFASAIPRRST